ncbi:MAG: urease accessory protein UreD [Candidatus Acidiferrales bacterium]
MARESQTSSAGFGATCSSNPERAGRDGFLSLRFERRGAATILSRSRFTLPLQALTPMTLEDGTAYLMLLNPTGGVLAGDRLVSHIVQECETHVCLTTPSATRVYRASDRPAVIDTRIEVGAGATLEYLPDHIIPHAGAALHQKLRVDLERGSRAILLDSFASGRVAAGERWIFREMDFRTEVYRRGKPLLLNRTWIRQQTQPVRQAGCMEHYDYAATLGIFADGFAAWQNFAIEMNRELESMPEISGGASLLSRDGCLVRFLGVSAWDMNCAAQRLWALARESVLGLPGFDPRKY